MRKIIFRALSLWRKVSVRLRGKIWCLLLPGAMKIGVHFKLLGGQFFQTGSCFSVGDFCWIECVSIYKGVSYTPSLIIGNNVSLSDFVHISCAASIKIGSGCLIGSNVYIGDNSHGAVMEYGKDNIAPASRNLSGLKGVTIGSNVWIGDGVRILDGASIASGSIVGANSVVKLSVLAPAVIAGIPAKVLFYLPID